METTKRLTRKEKRLLRQQGKIESALHTVSEKINFNLKDISPLTDNQRLTFRSFAEGKNLMLHGMAGTGKSFIALYLALQQVMTENSKYKKVVIVRSAVPTRDQGFQPGNDKEKAKVYELPYHAICSELFGRGDAYNYLKQRGQIDFITTSFIRGVTISNAIIIVDEMANCSLHELDSVITRIGSNCKIIFCGDFRQSDFTKEQEKAGLNQFMNVIRKMKSFVFVDFQSEDIVRSSLVREYIILKDKLGVTA